MNQFDDAGVYRLDAETALVVTLDFFPPLVDDAFAFGRIAAANSLSDLYAMGAKPLTALNIVGFPDNELPISLLTEILRGGTERVQAAGAVIAGGHSVRDHEIKYGLSVTGVVHPDRIVTNAGAKVGDRLVLTKPIGSGVLVTAARKGIIGESQLVEAVDAMIELNAGASSAMIEIGANAATDVTGFGLVGHTHEMASAGNVTIELQADSVLLLEGTLRLAAAGALTRAHESNLAHVGNSFRADGVDETLVKVLADAQTSGGLLIAVSEDRVDRLVGALKQRKTLAAAVVGRVTPRSEHTVVLS